VTRAELAGKAVVVTGSTRGIGRAVAELLVAEGASVVVNGRDTSLVSDVATELGAVGVAGSPAEPGVAERLVDAALASYSRLDGVVNVAGIAEPPGSSILTITSAEFRELIDVHLHATFETCRVAARHFVDAGVAGSIVNTTSFAFQGMYGGTGYPAGKGAVNSLTLALAAELREHGIRVNAVAPGARTRLSTGDDYEQHIDDLHRRGLLDDLTRAGSLEPAPASYVARLYAYLVSDLATGVTGEVLAGSGNYLARFAAPSSTMLAWRDHTAEPPWELAEIDAFVRG